MAPNTSITSDQSIALPEIVVTAPPPSAPSGVSSGNNPQNFIQPLAGASSSNLLVYPSDRPKYFMTFDIYEYSRQSLMSIGKLGAVLSTIVMPLSADLLDHNAVDWQDTTLGMGAWAYDQAATALRGIDVDKATGDISALSDAIARSSAAAGLAVAGGVTNTSATIAAFLGLGGAFDTARALLGFSPNQFLTLLFVGPKYKRVGFRWAVAPHTKQEADTLRKICNTFKNALSPRLALGGLVWKFPKIIKVGLHPNSRFLQKFKPLVIEEFTVNYTPTGRASFFKDPNPSAGENAPATMTIAMKLLEAEFWTAGNYNDSNDPDDTYTTE